ncbi:Transcription factor mbp1 [Coniosporium tulheliwenetii]|uniref:Transcription factor mbp1 n=1 Tax=Coniosporium tulheliwenetii TaxID=3383036 RepID=A0ACC2YUH0_9PEZI|nr:Transcription factor mbp1 [Cladosporium sp. JES 115]
MPQDASQRIYSATYSNVPVYEYNVEGNHVMRRRADDWINATHILKVADFDKPARTRILEREVQKGVHEKVQGGYGKYQGTWVPLHDGRALAERNNVLDKLLPIFDFVPGDRSPPPAPKHATAASNRPKVPRQPAAARRIAVPQNASQISEDHYDRMSLQFHDDETPDNVTIVSESMMDDVDYAHPSQYSTGNRKRKRGPGPGDQIRPPTISSYPPAHLNLDRAIDEKGHSAMHWAAAMGDVSVVKDLIARGARIDTVANNLETPLMRAVMFTNNFDKDTMPSLVRILHPTVVRTDWYGRTVFHHIAGTTSSKNKYACARYYLDTLIAKLSETWRADAIATLLNAQDHNGDTAIMIAARNGARKCVRALLGRDVRTDIVNKDGGRAAQSPSSSPFAPDRANGDVVVGDGLGISGALSRTGSGQLQQRHYRSQTAQTLTTTLAPSLLDKCTRLAAAYEAEFEEKEAEALDAERVARKRQVELDAIRAQCAELSLLGVSLEGGAHDEDDGGGGAEGDVDAALEEQLKALERESEALLELEQRFELRNLVARAEATAGANGAAVLPPASSADQHTDGDGGGGVDGGARSEEAEKLQLAQALLTAQHERQALVKGIVQDLAVAGIGERQAEYRRLITGALGVRDEDVESMLPEILAELEESIVGEGEGVEG